MPSCHSYKEKAVRRESFIPPGMLQHACGSLTISRPSSKHGGEAVPAWGRGSSRSLSLHGPPLTTGGDKCHRVLSPGEPRSQEDVHQAGYAPLDAHQGLSHFLLQWIQERNESRVMYFGRLIFESLFIPPLCFVGIYFQVPSAVHHNNIFNKISRKWDDNKTMIF